MEDPRKIFIDSLGDSGLSLKKFPSFVFLCGGPNPAKKPPFKSARQYIATCLDIDGIRFQAAEDITDWFKFDAYRNLLDFEEDIAEISKIVVLFVESAGSLVELGAFVKSQSIAPKLLVFIQSKYQRENSYINLGPEQYLEDQHKNSIKYYPWDFDDNEDLIEASIEDDKDLIIDDIKKHLAKKINALPKKDSKAFKFLLIHDLLFLFLALELRELIELLESLDVHVEEKDLKRALFCLERLDLVVKYKYGGMTCFLPRDENSDLYLSYKLADGGGSLIQLNCR